MAAVVVWGFLKQHCGNKKDQLLPFYVNIMKQSEQTKSRMNQHAPSESTSDAEGYESECSL